MSLTDTKNLTHVEFESIPELSRLSLEWLMLYLVQRKRTEDKHFGGYVIRAAGMDRFLRSADLLDREVYMGHVTCSTGSPITADHRFLEVDSGTPGDVTLWYSKEGSARLIVMEGSSQKTDSGETNRAATLSLFRDGSLNPNALTPPDHPLMVTANEGDLVVFDHTHPHAVEMLSGHRETLIAYASNPQR